MKTPDMDAGSLTTKAVILRDAGGQVMANEGERLPNPRKSNEKFLVLILPLAGLVGIPIGLWIASIGYRSEEMTGAWFFLPLVGFFVSGVSAIVFFVGVIVCIVVWLVQRRHRNQHESDES